MQDYLTSLNPEQREAVLHREGPAMIVAGAGSGKTRVLTYRIVHLIENGVDPFNILSLTFTNKAAKEMRERISSAVNPGEAKNIWMGTFHSVFARILRVEAEKLGYPSNFVIYDSQDSLSVLSRIIKDFQLDTELYKAKNILSRISNFKNNLITVKAYFNNPELQSYDASTKRPHMGKVYKEYVDRCFKFGAMDFDDLLLRTNEVLTKFPEVLAKYQDRFKYIMVDEYQDTNHSQYLILKALASRYENICVVGDDAQSIYSFRGANIQNILNFQKDYPDAKMFRLEQNYRSSQTIVKAANNVIEKNKYRIKKDVWTENEEGESIEVFQAVSDTEEAAFVGAQVLEQKLRNQIHNKDFCVLYRTNAQSRAIEEALRKRNIPYKVYGGISFYQRKEIKDLVGYLRLVLNFSDEEALRRVVNYPARGIGNVTLSKIFLASTENGSTMFDVIGNPLQYGLKFNAGTKSKLEDFHAMILSYKAMMETSNAFELVEHISKTSGIIGDLNKDKTPEGISRLENIQEFFNAVREFSEEQQELENGDPSLSAFLENIALLSSADDNDKEDNDKVSLMTIHLAKGLEYDYVFVVGLEENLFPSVMSVNTRDELEEERRLFYVALTRAKKKAYLTNAKMRYKWGKLIDNDPSRFISEIEPKYLKFSGNIGFAKSPKKEERKIFNPKTDNSKFKSFQKTPQRKTVQPQTQNLKKVNSSTREVTKSEADFNGQIYKVGQKVKHSRFGVGEIKSLYGDTDNLKAKVVFGHFGEKNLLLKFAKLYPVD